MDSHTLSTSFFWIFSGAAVFASIALYSKQPLIIVYIALGAIMGPYGFKLVENVNVLAEISHIGIVFLLFLLGLDMQPKTMISVVKQVSFVAITSSAIFAAVGYIVAYYLGFNNIDCLIIGIALMFSSTIIGIKLLPTTALHHKRSGEFMVGILLVQDLIAIILLIILMSDQDNLPQSLAITLFVTLPLFVCWALVFVKFILFHLFKKFDNFHEYIFLLALGWCLGMAQLADFIGLSKEIGAFIAGISLATSPISPFIALSLKPLRDFFLILFFFALGARFDLSLLQEILVSAAIVSTVLLLLKPVVFHYLMLACKEEDTLSWDVGFRLGQGSEFSLLIAYLASSSLLISQSASHLIQMATIITFIISSYIVVFNFPSPIAVTVKLRRD